MTDIYVDTLHYWPGRVKTAARRYGREWCHLFGSSVDDLHLFAKGIGLRKQYFQDKPGFPHYDLTPHKRNLAIIRGAKPISLIKWYRETHRETSNN